MAPTAAARTEKLLVSCHYLQRIWAQSAATAAALEAAGSLPPDLSPADGSSTGEAGAPNTGGGRAVSTGGGRAPTTGGQGTLNTGGERAPSTGGAGAPNTGGGGAPNTGGGEVLYAVPAEPHEWAGWVPSPRLSAILRRCDSAGALCGRSVPEPHLSAYYLEYAADALSEAGLLLHALLPLSLLRQLASGTTQQVRA